MLFAKPFASLYDGGNEQAEPKPFYSISLAKRKRGDSLGARDAVLRRYHLSGNLKWSRQFRTDSYDQANDVVFHDGDVFVVGWLGWRAYKRATSPDLLVIKWTISALCIAALVLFLGPMAWGLGAVIAIPATALVGLILAIVWARRRCSGQV